MKVETLWDCAQVGLRLIDKICFFLPSKVIDENVKAPHNCELSVILHVVSSHSKYLEGMLLLLTSNYGVIKKISKLDCQVWAFRLIKCISPPYSLITFKTVPKQKHVTFI